MCASLGRKRLKAARLLGPRRPLVISDLKDPHPGPGEVLVRVKASGVCHSDLHIIEGEFSGLKYPVTLGHEPAGYVSEIGSNVDSVQKGTPVLVYICQGCGVCWFCRRGEENDCTKGAEALGFDRDGSHAELLLVGSSRYLFPVPGLDLEAAAPLACAGLTAYHAVKMEALPVLRPGDYAVVIGVGGLGHIAVQLLRKMSSAHIIAVEQNEEKLRFAEKCGASHALLASANFNREVRKIAKEGVSVVLDFVGSTSTLEGGYDILRSRGRLVVVGEAGGSMTGSIEPARGREIHGSTLGSFQEMHELIELAKAKVFAITYQSFPLNQINDALRLMKEGLIIGRAVLTM